MPACERSRLANATRPKPSIRAMKWRHGLSGADRGKRRRRLFVDIFADMRDERGIFDSIAIGYIIPGTLVWGRQRACRRQPTGVRDDNGAVFGLLGRDIGHIAGERTKRARERLGAPVALVGPLGQRNLQDVHQLCRDARIEAADVGWAGMDVLEEDGNRRRTQKWRSASQGLIEHASKRVDVGAFVDLAPLGLFRRHVFRRADRRARLGQAARALNLGDAEIR